MGHRFKNITFFIVNSWIVVLLLIPLTYRLEFFSEFMNTLIKGSMVQVKCGCHVINSDDLSTSMNSYFYHYLQCYCKIISHVINITHPISPNVIQSQCLYHQTQHSNESLIISHLNWWWMIFQVWQLRLLLSPVSPYRAYWWYQHQLPLNQL